MQLRKSTIEKFANVLIRLGEASVIGSTATFFVAAFPLRTSIVGLIGCLVLISLGLYVNEISETKGK